MSDSYDDYETKIQLAEQAWEKRVVKTEHDRAVELGKAYERGWNAALAQREWVSEALRLADALDAEFVQGRISNSTGRESAVELRRLALKQWVGLTDDAVFELADTNLYDGGKNYGVLAFAKAIEQALREKNHG
jgi:hypothetical protein